MQRRPAIGRDNLRHLRRNGCVSVYDTHVFHAAGVATANQVQIQRDIRQPGDEQ